MNSEALSKLITPELAKAVLKTVFMDTCMDTLTREEKVDIVDEVQEILTDYIENVFSECEADHLLEKYPMLDAVKDDFERAPIKNCNLVLVNDDDTLTEWNKIYWSVEESDEGYVQKVLYAHPHKDAWAIQTIAFDPKNPIGNSLKSSVESVDYEGMVEFVDARNECI